MQIRSPRKKISDILSNTGKVFGFEGRGARKDGNEFWGTLSIRSVFNSDGNLKFYEGSLIDITERIKREKAEREREAAKASAAAKSEFLANMSHEIRTPMNTMIGLTELLSKDNPPEKCNEYVAKIKDASGTLKRMIDDILDFSKIEAGKLELEHEDFSISDIFDKLAVMFSNLISGKKIELIFSISKEIPTTLHGDPFRLGQVLINLVSNAIKFTNEGEIHVRTELVEKGKESLKLRLSVIDTGIGIPEDKISILFQPFAQADGSITRRYGGTGLGLAICKNIVDKMGGRIWVESRQGTGSSFIFEIQVGHREEDEPLTITSDDLKHRKWLAVEKSKILRDGLPDHLHILLVEDNPINRRIIKEMLESFQIEVRSAHNGEDALKSLEAFDYDAVLMDVQMPEMDGFEVTRRIRQYPRHQNLAIIALTAYAGKGFREKCLAAGMDDYVTKPIDFQQLVSKLSLHLNAKKTEPSEELLLERSADKKNQIDISENFPVIDESSALERMGGRRQLYLSVLKEFYNEYKDISEMIKNAQQKGDSDFIRRTAHTVKGLAANIGADALKSAAEALEVKCKKGDDVIDSSCIEEFETRFRIVLDAVKNADSVVG